MRLPCGHDVVDENQLHYCTYLQLDRILSAQPDPGALRHHDELLFIITHQSFELWFKLALHEVDAIIALLQRDEVTYATWLVRRVVTIFRTINPMMSALESMSPPDFFEFREALAPASGTESIQFRELEIASGLRDPHFRKFLETPADPAPERLKTRQWTERLAERWEQPSLHSAFIDLLRRRGVTPAGLYRPSHVPNPHADLLQLAEALLDYEEVFLLQRFLHARLAERHLGHVRGTGMTSGVAYLDAAVHRPRFFPELWEARAEVWEQMSR
jgi:tryptophan 2,3-dioxygenase